ncbi:hypothetical protein [Dialister succinatiphilus]|uniref:hypothetical protein n=1 Tax=Dialister succinatiphilus TaxID=487173 RepID=UPI004024E57D
MIQGQLIQLSEMNRDLSIEEKMLDYYTNHAPEGKVTFTMQVADSINRQAYEKKKQLIADLEKEIAREGEIINLHFTIPDLPSGMMPLSAFNHFTQNLDETLRLIGEDIIRKIDNCSLKAGRRQRKFYNPEIQLLSMTPGSFNVQLGALNDPDSLFYGSDEERKVNILYKSGTRLLNIMYTLSCRDDLSRLADDNDEILESVQSLYQDMDKDDLSLDITWTRHPSRSTFTIPHKDTAPIAQALKNYVEQRQQAVQLQRITGTITTLNMEKYSLRLKKKDSAIITVKFEKENISDLMEHQVNPLYQKEYTIYVICENKPKKKNIYRFRRFEN